MDINEIPFENDKEEEFAYHLDRCYYTIFSCPPSFDAPYGSLAFITFIPENHDRCGLLKVFNLEKNTKLHGFHTSVDTLKAKYHAMKKLVERNNKATLVWEGNPNALKYGEIYVRPIIDRFDQFPYFIFN